MLGVFREGWARSKNMETIPTLTPSADFMVVCDHTRRYICTLYNQYRHDNGPFVSKSESGLAPLRSIMRWCVRETSSQDRLRSATLSQNVVKTRTLPPQESALSGFCACGTPGKPITCYYWPCTAAFTSGVLQCTLPIGNLLSESSRGPTWHSCNGTVPTKEPPRH